MNKQVVKLALTLSLIGIINPSYASKGQMPHNVTPGALNTFNTDNFNRQVEQIPEYKEGKAEKYEVKQEVTSKPIKSPNGKITYNPTFTLNEIKYFGNTVVSNEELDKFSKEYINKEITVKDLIALTQKITRYYHSKGYLTSKAYLAPQKIEKGIVEITFTEGKIANLKIQGNKWARDTHLKRILKQNKVSENDVLNVNKIQQTLKDINENDYIKGKVVVDNAGTKAEDHEIVLKVKDRFPLNFSVTWDNEGRESLGKNQATLIASHNNLTGLGDSIYAGTILNDNSIGVLSGYSVPINSKGTKLNFGYSFSDMNLGGEYSELGINGYSHNFSLGVTHPLVKKDNFKLMANTSFDLRNSKTKMDNVGELTDHRVRALRVGLSARKDDRKGVWLANFNTSTGIPLFNATEGSQALGYEDSKFVKINADLKRYQRLPLESTGIFRIGGQYTPNKLLSSEKMQLGGRSTVRGIEPGLLIGDGGFTGSLEVRRKIPMFTKILPDKLGFIDDRVQMGAFYDCGLIRDIHGYKGSTFLQSVGAGLHINLTKFLTAHLDLGVPLGRQVDDQDARLSFSLTAPLQNLWTKNLSEDL